MKNFTVSLLLFLTIPSWSQFGPLIDLGPGSLPLKILLEDLDMDGDRDILLLTFSGVHWKENLGMETFSELRLIGSLFEGPTDFVMYDFDLDGDNDILAYNTGDWLVKFFKNDGDEVFEEIVFMPGFEFLTQFEISDIDLDGDTEFVALKTAGVYAITPDGLGGIEETIQLVDGSFGDETDIKLFDMDNDLDPDVIWSNFEGDIFYSENLGAGTYAEHDIVATDIGHVSSVFAIDLDGDLDLDVISGAWGIDVDAEIVWYENLGGGDFGPGNLISSEVLGRTQVFAADVDLDGDADVLSSSFEDDKIAWYENLGDGVFADQTILSTDMDGASDLKLMDNDGDGDLDVFAISRLGSRVVWFENLTDNASDVGLQDYQNNNVMLYPNPTNGITNIYFNSVVAQPYDIVVYDLLGHVIYQAKNLTGNKAEIQSSEFGTGLYILTIADHKDNQTMYQGKIIVE